MFKCSWELPESLSFELISCTCCLLFMLVYLIYQNMFKKTISKKEDEKEREKIVNNNIRQQNKEINRENESSLKINGTLKQNEKKNCTIDHKLEESPPGHFEDLEAGDKNLKEGLERELLETKKISNSKRKQKQQEKEAKKKAKKEAKEYSVKLNHNYDNLGEYIKEAEKILVEIFITNWNKKNEEKWEDTEEFRLKFFWGPGITLRSEIKNYGKHGYLGDVDIYENSISSWGMPILSDCIKCLDTDLPEEFLEKFCLLALELYYSNFEVTDEEYLSFWKRLSFLLLELKTSTGVIDDYKPSSVFSIKREKQPEESVLALKELGMTALKEKRFGDAIKHLSHAAQIISRDEIPREELYLIYSTL